MTDRNLPIPSGVVTGVGILATLGIVAIAGIALKAGIVLGQTSRKQADKRSARTGEWVEPSVFEAANEIVGKFVTKNALKAGKVLITRGGAKLGQTTGISGTAKNVRKEIATYLRNISENEKLAKVEANKEITPDDFIQEDIALTADEAELIVETVLPLIGITDEDILPAEILESEADEEHWNVKKDEEKVSEVKPNKFSLNGLFQTVRDFVPDDAETQEILSSMGKGLKDELFTQKNTERLFQYLDHQNDQDNKNEK